MFPGQNFPKRYFKRKIGNFITVFILLRGLFEHSEVILMNDYKLLENLKLGRSLFSTGTDNMDQVIFWRFSYKAFTKSSTNIFFLRDKTEHKY